MAAGPHRNGPGAEPRLIATETNAASATRGTQSLHRAMQLLAAVGEHNATGARLTLLAQQTGLHVATAHRLLAALVREQMVSYDATYTKRYFLGVRLHGLIDLARYSTVRTRLRSFLEGVVAETGDVAYLYVPLLNDMIGLDRVDGPRPARGLVRDIGRRLPMGIGAGSLAVLAALPEARARALVASNAGRYGEYGGPNAETIWSAVREARTAGFGMTREQVAKGVIGVGFALCDERAEPVAAVTVVGTPARMSDRHVEEVVGIVQQRIAAVGALTINEG